MPQRAKWYEIECNLYLFQLLKAERIYSKPKIRLKYNAKLPGILQVPGILYLVRC
jgi:hypothetical protein